MDKIILLVVMILGLWVICCWKSPGRDLRQEGGALPEVARRLEPKVRESIARGEPEAVVRKIAREGLASSLVDLFN